MDDDPLFDHPVWAILANTIRILILIGAMWLFYEVVLDDEAPPGRCQQELGYMGTVDYVECEPDE